MKNLFLGVAAAMGAVLTTSAKAETINCTEITSVPAIITAQGVYCLKSDKSSTLASGDIIDIQTNNVTIDLNGFKLGGLGAGPATLTTGINAANHKNITIRNGSIRGFLTGVLLSGNASGGLVEGLLLDGSRANGIFVQGTGHVIRNNRIVNTGSGASDQANGILASSANRTVIADNVISSVSETNIANGIRVVASTAIEVRDNSIFDVKDATNSIGISLEGGSTKVTVIGNRVINVPLGNAGIIEFSGNGVGCIDNTVTGFTTAISGCDFIDGNHSF